MKDIFWINESHNIYKTYEDLIHDLNAVISVRKYIYAGRPYDVFLQLLASIVHGLQVDILDADFSLTEVANLGIDTAELNREIAVVKKDITDYAGLVRAIHRQKDSWRLTLYTSGTTGRPKHVTHNLVNLTRTTRIEDRFRKNVWAFAYNPTHFAGLQVFFQAFFNHNAMIYIFEGDRSRVDGLMNKYSVTHISATPTFYRMIIPYISRAVESLRKAVFGGEQFDEGLRQAVTRVFPNASIGNIYASTEAGSLFQADGASFVIPAPLKPLVKIGPGGELFLHKQLLGQSGDFNLAGDWYATGDIVALETDNRFRFISRKTEFINVAGYKVNPYEVEEALKKIDGVLDAAVKARKNRITGNILAADVVKEARYPGAELEIKIRESLGRVLQEWKIPRIFRFVEEVPQTKTGKKVRQ